MSEPLASTDKAYADVANDLSTIVAPLLPRDPADVATFVSDAAFALGETDAGLARLMGVSRATLSSWKNRGSIPAVSLRWFKDEFAAEVLSRFVPGGDMRHAGIRVALRLLRETDFDPFGVTLEKDMERIEVCYRRMDGLARLGLFILRRMDFLSEGADHFEAAAARVLGAIASHEARRVLTLASVSQ